MASFTGKVLLKEEKGSSVLTLDGIPVAKLFEPFNDQDILLSIYQLHPQEGTVFIQNCHGTADVFYFEGEQQFYTGTKYVNDFYIDDEDIIHKLESLVDMDVRLTVNEE
ncbi:hypothetical protein ACOJQI_03215 [Bacillus salacetis]|uniref:hypothetical protein n=1 Tax=Bacillus salacetis TaxID=2315464 RepID=UPI003BA2AC56